MQPQDAIVFLFAFSVRVPRTDVCTVRRRCGKVPGSDRERQNSISLIGMEWHQTMAKYIIKRVAMGIFSIFIVATVTFFVMNLVPGGPFVAEKSISAAAQQALAEKYGLDKPLGVQYVNYMKSLLPEPASAWPHGQRDHRQQAAGVLPPGRRGGAGGPVHRHPAGLYLGLQPRQVAGQHHHRVRNLRHCDPELYFQRAAVV